MTEEELDLAERMFQIIKEDKRMPEPVLREMALKPEEKNDPQKIKAGHRIVRLFHEYGLIHSELSRGHTIVSLSSTAGTYYTLKEFFDELNAQRKEEEVRQAKEEERADTQHKLNESQLFMADNWLPMLLLSAAIGVIGTLIVQYILGNL